MKIHLFDKRGDFFQTTELSADRIGDRLRVAVIGRLPDFLPDPSGEPSKMLIRNFFLSPYLQGFKGDKILFYIGVEQ